MSSALVFRSFKSKFYFSLLNGSNSSGTVDYGTCIHPKIDYPINHVIKSITIQELNTLHHMCQPEKTQFL